MCNMSIRNAIYLGAFVGMAGAATLFFTNTAYHDYTVMIWTNPWSWAIAGAAGLAGWLDD